MADPETIGKYEIRGVLGKGAMGVVYKGFDPHVERTVAIKTVRKDLVDPDIAAEIMTRFRNEARAAGRLLHPNIVTIYEYGDDGGTAFIAMEFVEGTGLREYLNRKASLGVPQIVSIMAQLMLALAFAHERGVVHRDIKPANLILTPQGALKVADFGIARIDTSTLTSAGMVIGTPSYMSPEQCTGKPIDHRADLFSAGVVLYELLTGEKPFVGALETIVYKICHEEPRAPSQASHLPLSPAVDAFMAKALAKKPEARYPTARDFLVALRHAFDPQGAPNETEDMTVMDFTSVTLLPIAPPAWEDTVLGTVERQLAQFVGPMAKVMVKKAAAQAHDLAGLYTLLSANIGDDHQRRRFADGIRSVEPTVSPARGGTSPGTSAAPRTPKSPEAAPSAASASRATGERTRAVHVPLDQTFVDQIAGKLAVYLGPIAKVLTRKAAQQAAGQQEFVRLVAGHLGAQERGAFLREIGFTAD